MPKVSLITDNLPPEMSDCFVAGGAITSIYTNKPINDIDVYPKSYAAYECIIALMYESGYYCADHSERAVTFANGLNTPVVQIMHFDEFSSAEKIFECFDFTVCMGAYDMDKKEFILHDMFLEHCSQRVLCFNPKTRFPYASAWRVNKYKQRGYTIGKFEHFKILAACATKPIQSWDELKDQIGGIYGEAVRIPENVEFSTENMFAAMNETLTFPDMRPIGCAEEVILATSRREISYFEHNNGIYANIYSADGDGYLRVQSKPRNGRLIDRETALQNMTFYKKVSIGADGVLQSIYKPSFKYYVGEFVESGSPFIYAKNSIPCAQSYHTSTRDKVAIIELKPRSADDIIFDSGNDVRLKRALVTRVVSML